MMAGRTPAYPLIAGVFLRPVPCMNPLTPDGTPAFIAHPRVVRGPTNPPERSGRFTSQLR